MLSFLLLCLEVLILATYGAMYEGRTTVVGCQNITLDVTLRIESQLDTVDITMKGPSDRYFGFGFGNTVMDDTYVIIVQSEPSQVFEQKLGHQVSGTQLTPSTITVNSDVTTGNTRTIDIQRERIHNYYSFPTTDIDIIFALSTYGLGWIGNHGTDCRNTSKIRLLRTATSYPTKMPSTQPTTQIPTQPTSNPTTRQPTAPPTQEYYLCGSHHCPYVIFFEFQVLYNFADSEGVYEKEFKAILAATMSEVLSQWIPNSLNIDISTQLSYSNDNGQIEMMITLGIENDNVYIAIKDAFTYGEITDAMLAQLPVNINEAFADHGFVMNGEVASDWRLVNGTFSTTGTGEATKRALFQFIYFEFNEYTLYDYVLFMGCIVCIMLCCACCICFYCKMQNKKIPESVLRAKTGINRISVWRKELPPKEKPEIKLFEFTSKSVASNSQQKEDEEELEDEPVPYKPNYADTPLQHDFNRALTAAVENPHYNMDAKGRDAASSFGAMSTVSFGNALSPTDAFGGGALQNRGHQQIGFRIHEEKKPHRYEDDYYGDDQDPLNGQGAGGHRGPPMVSGSMVQRMNHGNQYLGGAPPGNPYPGGREGRGPPRNPPPGRREGRGPPRNPHPGGRGGRGPPRNPYAPGSNRRGAPPNFAQQQQAPQRRGGAPPTVTGSMVDRMNRGNAFL